MIETVRVSQQAKEQLSTLKRRTGITQWNILCRWALMRSLAEPSVPSKLEIKLDSNVEMTWKTFAGDNEDLIYGLLQARLLEDGLDLTDDLLEEHFRLHLHRGIGYLIGDEQVKSIEGLVGLASSSSHQVA
jgi:DNA sulfur modification protein DndE